MFTLTSAQLHMQGFKNEFLASSDFTDANIKVPTFQKLLVIKLSTVNGTLCETSL